jgi:hypothetical protein
MFQRTDDGLLNEIVGVDHVARPAREPAARPPLQERNRAGEDLVEGCLIPRARPGEELDRAFRLTGVFVARVGSHPIYVSSGVALSHHAAILVSLGRER